MLSMRCQVAAGPRRAAVVVQRQQRLPSSSVRQARTLTRIPAIEEKRDTSGTETTSTPSDLLPDKLAELRRQAADAPAKSSSNIVQGALEEAQLITWPKPGKALLDTVLVLAIVAGTGAALFGVNVLLTDAFNWWYHH